VVAFATTDSASSVVAAMTEFGCEVIEGPMETSGLVVDH
jgi:hypothetical protein